MTKEEFNNYLKHPEMLDQSTIEGLKEIITDYPCFPAARMLYLRNLLNINSYRFESELVAHAIFIPDRKKLYQLLNPTDSELTEFQLLPYDKDAFSRFFGNEKGTLLHNEELPVAAPFVLKATEDSGQQFESDLIDQFINKNPTITTLQKPNSKTTKSTNDAGEPDEVIDDGLITETLAGIYVQQGLYPEALKAYRKLSLRFPEKNSYFASQIEKINKLISKEL